MYPTYPLTMIAEMCGHCNYKNVVLLQEHHEINGDLFQSLERQHGVGGRDIKLQ